MSYRISLRGLHILIRVDTLRRVHTVGFLVGRLICCLTRIYVVYVNKVVNIVKSQYNNVESGVKPQ